mgnify:CR=1 FL=1
MATRTEKYWQQRFEQVTEAQLKTGMDYYDEAERMYREAMESIEKDIARWYMRLAANNQITYADAKKLLTNSQLKDFKLTLKEYIKRGKENGISADWSKSLENASAKYHISRLEALQMQIQQHLEALYGNQLDGMDAAMRGIYRDSYYQTAYELQKGFSTGFDVQQIDDARLERLMSKPWAADGLNFSQRLWSDKDKLINNLQNELVQGLVRGDAQLKIVQSFSKRMNTSLSNAGRLIATESAYFASLGEKDGMKDLGVDQYEILATLDRKTSDICRSMDGKVFKMSEFKAGVTAPPLHPWCRSCTVPHIEGLDSGLRAARDDDGKVYYVPGNMKYSKWKEKFVDNSRSNVIKRAAKENGIRGIINLKPEPVNLARYGFDDKHINKKRKHNVTKEDAQQFINNALVAFTRWNGQYLCFFASEGSAYIDVKNKIIRTAFKREQFDEKSLNFIKVVESFDDGNDD